MPLAPETVLPRRGFVFGAGTVGAALAGFPAMAQAPGMSELPSGLVNAIQDPKETLKLYVKLNADTSGKPVYSWFSGHVYAVDPGNITKPLFGVEGYGMGWAAPRPDGSFRQIWKEVGYYTDLKTGAIMNAWHNPLNGAKCEVLHIHNRSVNVDLLPVGEGFSAPGLQLASGGDLRHADEPGPQPFTLPWFVLGDTVATSMDTRVSAPNPLSPKEWPRESSGERYSVTEFTMHYASLKELLDERLTRVSTVGHWTRIVPWLPWMLMGQAPGQCIYRAATKKLKRFADIPERLVDYSRKHFPEFLALSTPEEQALPPESSYEVYKATRKPAPL